jgi:hypothetical protein
MKNSQMFNYYKRKYEWDLCRRSIFWFIAIGVNFINPLRGFSYNALGIVTIIEPLRGSELDVIVQLTTNKIVSS